MINKRIIGSLSRPDALDQTHKIIYELKPYNQKAFKKALKQTKKYSKILGDKYTIVIDMYRL